MVATGDKTFASDVLTIIAGTLQKPLCRLRQVTAQTGVAHNTQTIVTFDTEDFDTHGAHSTSSNTGRITPQVAGYYRFSATVLFQNRTDWTLLLAFFRKNGATATAPAGRVAPSATSNLTYAVSCTAIQPMDGVSDYMEVMCQASNGASASYNLGSAGGALVTTFECEFLRSL